MEAVDAVREFLWASSPVDDLASFGLPTPLLREKEEGEKKGYDNPARIGALTVSGKFQTCQM